MPPHFTSPGVYVEESGGGGRTVSGAPTSVTAFVGRARKGPVATPVRVQSFAEFVRVFGGLWTDGPMGDAVELFFRHGGVDALIVRVRNGAAHPASSADDDDGAAISDADILGDEGARTGIYALERADLFNLLCIPPPGPGRDLGGATWAAAAAYCVRRRAMLLVDAPSAWTANADAAIAAAESGVAALRSSVGDSASRNTAVYFPRLRMPDPLSPSRLRDVAPCGAVAGIIARTDAQRGVWKAPAGVEASLSGVVALTCTMTDAQHEILNAAGLNGLRTFPASGHVVWGARTLSGASQGSSEWKYLPVRRLALHVEESLCRGTQWAVFEPNDEPLWLQLRLSAETFLHRLFAQGAFQGVKAEHAYFVRCGRETITENDIDAGIVNMMVGFAPLKPAEFIVVTIRLTAGQIWP